MREQAWTPAARGPWDEPGLDVQGHRGARGLVAESTVAGFRRAADEGCRSVELDVHLSADGVPVVWHDPVLSPARCTGHAAVVGRRIDELTVAQLAQVDCGSVTDPRFPAQQAVAGACVLPLETVLRQVRTVHPRLWWTVELKCDPTDPRDLARRPSLVEAVSRVLHATGAADRSMIHSFDWGLLRLAARVDPTLTRSALFVPDGRYATGSPWAGGVDVDRLGGDLPAAVVEAGAHALCPWFARSPEQPGAGDRPPTSPPLPLACDAALVRRAHALGLAVVPWTVNHPADLRAVVAAGVDGVITDHPDRALAAALEVGCRRAATSAG